MATRTSASLTLFSFKGIPVRVHWSFLLLVVYVLFTGLSAGMAMPLLVQQLLYVCAVFCCVVLHEFGHALTALRYGVKTRSITLLPIGGVASLERIPEEPRQELLVTVAGPLVNLAIAAVVSVPFILLGHTVFVEETIVGGAGVVALARFLIVVNIGLFFFNLVPAFPMDGGRILRSILALRMDRVRATRIAGTVGKVFAGLFVLAAFGRGNPMLALIGVFIFFGATAEMHMVATQRVLRGARARDVMRTRFWSMPHDATVQQAAADLLAVGDHAVVVLRNGLFDRVVDRATIIQAMQQGDPGRHLDTLAATVPDAVPPDAEANSIQEKLARGLWPLMPVIENGRLIGVLEQDNLAEYVELNQAAPERAILHIGSNPPAQQL
ncbi:MAG TPA: site-2 protease family protein [Flavobacteriales bacterium]|nr:site-2 protease family protein [Flavobacteriales bacterium]